MDEFTIIYPEQDAGQRQAFRTKIPGLEALIKSPRVLLPIKDFSATGLTLVDAEARLGQGDKFEFDLLLNKKLLIPGLTAKAMRILEHGLVGCAFVDLDSRKEAKLDKLVLEVQKRIIALKKAKSEQE